MRLNLILLALLVFLGVGISILLVPREKDVALIRLHSDASDEARQVLLEQYDRGDRSVAVIASLAEIAINDGEIPTAVGLLETYVDRNPKDVSARRRLAEYYRFDQRRDDFVNMLAQVVSLGGTPQERRQLANLYRLRGEYRKLLPVLVDLIERREAKQPDYAEAAGLAASVGDYGRSLTLTESMWRLFPESLNARSLRLYVLVAAAAGRVDGAVAAVGRLAGGESGPAAVVPVIREVADRGQDSLGLKLLNQFEDELHKTPQLLVTWARMQMGLNQEAIVRERLLALEEKGQLPELAVPVLIDLALLGGDVELIVDILRERNVRTMTASRLRAVADLAVFERRSDLLRQILDQALPAFKDEEPSLMAEIWIALGEPDQGLSRIYRARRQVNPRLDQMIRQARAEISLNLERDAAQTLDRIAHSDDLDEPGMRTLAQFYIRAERVKQGLAVFERLRRERPSFAAEGGWARLATWEGRDREVLAWLGGLAGLGEDLLGDIVSLGLPDRAPLSALEAARRLERNHPNPESRRLLAEALLANGRAAEALPILEGLLPGGAEEAGTYISALYALDRRDDAFRFLEERGTASPLEPRLADDFIALAFDLGRSAAAYRELERQEPGRLSDDTLVNLVSRAAEDDRLDVIDRVVAGTDAAFLQARPVLAAEVALARGNTDEAMLWAYEAAGRPDLRLPEKLALARLWGRLGEEANAVELLRSLAADPDTPAFALGDLGAAYLRLGRQQEGLRVFRDLKLRRQEVPVVENWARLETAAGDTEAVRNWLAGTRDVTPQALADLHYIALERPANGLALQAARRLAEARPSPVSDRILANALLANGLAAEALPLVEGLLPGDTELAETYVGILGQLGRNAEALSYLAGRRGGDGLPLRLADDLIALAFDQRQPRLAYEEASRHPLRDLPEETLVSLALNAADDRETPLLARIASELDQSFLDIRPVLAAMLAQARGSRDEANEWANVALSGPALNGPDTLRLATVLSGLERTGDALRLLAGVADDPDTAAAALADLANAYLTLGRAEEGLSRFRRLRQARREAQVAESWARLEAGAGDPASVARWLADTKRVSVQALTDIHYIALDRQAAALSLQAAKRLSEAQPGQLSDRLLANALLLNGQPAEAIHLIEGLLPGDDALAEAYVGALTALRRNSEAFDFLEARRGDGALPLQLADDYVSLAFDRERPALAYAEADRHPFSSLPVDTLVTLAQSATADRAFGLFDRIVAELGPEFLEKRPVLAASLALARDRQDEARRWAGMALKADDRSNADAIRLANVYLGLGEPSVALDLLAGVAGDPETPALALADLAGAYLSLGRAREGLPVFRRLVLDRTEAPVHEGWARLETAEGEPGKVLDWLQGAASPSPQVLADIHYLAAGRRADRLAFRAGEIFYNTYPGPESRRIFATSLMARGRAEDAVPLLEALLPGDDEIAEAYVAALSAVNRKAAALAFLARRTDGERLPVRIADDFMALAIELDQPKLAYAEARRQDLSRFDGDTIASLAENAAEDNDLELIDQIVAQTGESFWNARPVMAARIEIARGNMASALDWANRAEAAGDLTNAEALRLARVFSDLNENQRSVALLERLADDPDTPAFAMGDLATQYLFLGQEKRGLPVFRRLIQRRDDPLIREGWARLETRAGEPARVLEWLRRADPGRQALTDIYYLSAERRATDLALESSQRLFDRYPGQEARLIRGQALTAAGRGKEAVAVLKPLLPGSAEVRSAYVAALGRGGDARDLRAFAEQALDEPGLEPELRSALLYALLENGAPEIALPRLRELAARDPATWETAYLDALRRAGTAEERVRVLTAKLDGRLKPELRDQFLFELMEAGGPERALPYLKKTAEAEPAGIWSASYEAALAELGRTAELTDWLSRRARQPATPERVRREIAFRLLDLNAKREAEDIFLRLAGNAGPESPDVQQLVYLWGPKPPERGLDWLEGRARLAKGVEKGHWLSLLADVRAYDRVVAIGTAPAPSDAADPALRPVVSALLATRSFDHVSRILDPIISRTDDTKRLLQMADWAEQADQQNTAVVAYQKALTGIGDDTEALLKAGRAFTFAGRAELAVDTLERYFRAPGNKAATDHRPWYYYGQALSQMNRQPEAREAYRRMLAIMRSNDVQDFDSRRMAATAHEALGDGERAVGIYEGLLAERPRDRSLVADFAALLIELREFERAELLLSQN